jgi:hypothetical protein
MDSKTAFLVITALCGLSAILSAVRRDWSSLGFLGIGIIAAAQL